MVFFTLGVMLCRAVVVWRDVKQPTSAWRGGGKNTHSQSEELEVRTLVINL